MLKVLLYLLFLILLSGQAKSQLGNYDSLKQVAYHSNNDTARIKALYTLAESYGFYWPDSAIYFIIQSIELSEKINYLSGTFRGYARFSFILNTTNNYSKGLEMGLKSLKIAEQLKTDRDLSMARSYSYLAILNRRSGFDSIAYALCHQSLYLFQKAKVVPEQMNFSVYLDLALLSLKFKMPDSALYFATKGYEVSLHQTGIDTTGISVSASTLANVYEVTGDFANAKKYYLVGLQAALRMNALLLRARFFNNYARFFRRTGHMDSAIYYAGKALELARNRNFGEHASDAAAMLEQIYEQGHSADSAVKYMKVLLAVRDSIFSQAKLQQFQLLGFDENQSQKDILAAKERYRTQVRNYGMIAAAGIFFLLSGILYRNNRRRQLANKKLERQKIEIERQRSKAEDALMDLKATQTQLVQSEKMASLGELTAGIAHEIQNPLNFVNNFSEVSSELIEEMKTELSNDRTDDAIAIADNLKSNLEKIIHHGKRADEIVKGMLQHSRTSTGQKEPIDINALVDEYVRLAYHGLRARDNSFKAEFKTNLDRQIGKINIISQDIGRVLLNLINNTFHALSEKLKLYPTGFNPVIEISTKKLIDKVEIRIRDNGTGIPRIVVDKIFQPFFTTKTSGKGTGLGLSISYDIITKGHGGEMRVESREGEFTEFIIVLPAYKF